MSYKNWAFTDFELLNWQEIFDSEDVSYVGWGEEICPKTKKKHFQGWIQLKTRRRIGGVKKIIGSNKIHLERCFGSEETNEKYCRKDGKFSCLGKFTKQGERKDLDEIKEEIRKEPTLEYVLENHFETYCRYKNGIEKWIQHCQKKNSLKEFRKPEVIVIYGETGTGKTKHAMKYADYKISGDDMTWWDGYDGEKTICIDEYDSQIKLTEMLGLLDGYSKRLAVKGGFTYAQWSKVIITSNVDPREWHMNAKLEHRKALMRRLSKVIHLGKGCVEVVHGNTSRGPLEPICEKDDDFF